MNDSVDTEEETENVTEVIDREEVEESTKEENTSAEDEAINALEKEKDEFYQRMIRVQAEFDNFKKRSQKERAADLKYKSEELISELLPALDNFERALEVEVTKETKGIIDGITMVYNQIESALESQGVEVIKAKGEEFDPNLHHAVMQVEEDGVESNKVVEELQKGYMLKDKVIRAAMVKVNK